MLALAHRLNGHLRALKSAIIRVFLISFWGFVGFGEGTIFIDAQYFDGKDEATNPHMDKQYIVVVYLVNNLKANSFVLAFSIARESLEAKSINYIFLKNSPLL